MIRKGARIKGGFNPYMIEAEKLSKWDWEPPEGLTINALTDFERPFIPLDTALNLLAYGAPNFEIDFDDPNWPLAVARTTRAWKRLRSAAENGTVELIGGDIICERIDPNELRKGIYVLVPGKDNSIEPDLEKYTDEAFRGIFEGGLRPQFHCVQVDKATFGKWLSQQLTTWKKSKALPMTDEELRQWIHAKATELSGRPPIDTWEKCPELSARGVTRARFDGAWHELYPAPDRGRPRKKKLS
jgi:hypothetical protein